jgi:hypothetical protein
MNCEHVDPKAAGRPDRSADGIGNVVELQIQEYLLAPGQNLFDQARPFARKDLQSQLKTPDMA